MDGMSAQVGALLGRALASTCLASTCLGYCLGCCIWNFFLSCMTADIPRRVWAAAPPTTSPRPSPVHRSAGHARNLLYPDRKMDPAPPVDTQVAQPLSGLLTGTMPDPTDQKRLLLVAVKHSYPVFDSVMCETIVDAYLKYPDATPDQIIAAVPKDFFVTEKVLERLASPDEPRLEIVVEGSHEGASTSSAPPSVTGDPPSIEHHADTDGPGAEPVTVVPPSTGHQEAPAEERPVPAQDPPSAGNSGSV